MAQPAKSTKTPSSFLFYQSSWWPSFRDSSLVLVPQSRTRLASFQMHYLRQVFFSPANSLSLYVCLFFSFETKAANVDFLRFLLDRQENLEAWGSRFHNRRARRARRLDRPLHQLYKSRSPRRGATSGGPGVRITIGVVDGGGGVEVSDTTAFGSELKFVHEQVGSECAWVWGKGSWRGFALPRCTVLLPDEMLKVKPNPYCLIRKGWKGPLRDHDVMFTPGWGSLGSKYKMIFPWMPLPTVFKLPGPTVRSWLSWEHRRVRLRHIYPITSPEWDCYWLGRLHYRWPTTRPNSPRSYRGWRTGTFLESAKRRVAWTLPHESRLHAPALVDFYECLEDRFCVRWDLRGADRIDPSEETENRFYVPALGRVCQISLPSLLEQRVYPLYSLLDFYQTFLDAHLRYIALGANARLISARDHSAQYKFFWNFQGRRLFLTLHDGGGEGYNYFFLSLGLFLKFFKYKKCLKKSKLMKLLLVKYARKLLIVTELEELHFRIRGVPSLFPELLRVFLTPVVTPFRHPRTAELYRDVEETQRRRPFFPMSIVHTRIKPYNYMRGKKKGRLKRKITKRLISQSRVCD